MATVLRLLLRGVDPEAIAAALAGEADGIWDGVAGEPGARLRVLALQPGVAERTPHAQVMRGVPFEAALEIGIEDHHRHWLNRHGWLVKPGADASGTGCRQFHADPKASSYAARRTALGRHEFEGIAVACYPDADGYLRVMSNADRLAPILEDERRFIDMETSSPGLYETVLGRDAA
jgi:hypothetical protein